MKCLKKVTRTWILKISLFVLVGCSWIIIYGQSINRGCGSVKASLSSSSEVWDEAFITDKDGKFITRREALLLGGQRKIEDLLVIGIPTVVRNHEGKDVIYVLKTVHALLDHLSSKDLLQIKLVIFLGDSIPEKRAILIEKVRRGLQYYLEAGLVHVIVAPERYYRPLNGLHKAFGDSEARVAWRSKQNLDYAYLMKYSSALGRYYMQLEDDVIARSGYFDVITWTIKTATRQQKSWTKISFSDEGFIAKLYQTSFIDSISNVLLMLYTELPCDWLIPEFQVLFQILEFKGENLFHHIGKHSSKEGTK